MLKFLDYTNEYIQQFANFVMNIILLIVINSNGKNNNKIQQFT